MELHESLLTFTDGCNCFSVSIVMLSVSLLIMKSHIAYIGSTSPGSTSLHRADAFRRIGCNVTLLDPQRWIGSLRSLENFLHYRTGYRFLQRRLLREFNASMSGLENPPDLILVNGGEMLGPCILKWLRLSFDCKIILYQNDDPTGCRDGNRFLSLRAALPFYDLCLFVRPESALEALALGAQHVLRIFTSYDELLHIPCHYKADHAPEPLQLVVSFIGTLIPGEARDIFLAALIQAGLPLRLFGNQWQRSSLWPVLKASYHGPGLKGVAYSEALGNAAVSLGFLSHQNRDLLTRRSFETPACAGLLCAERTSEHQLFYEDCQEAVFWDSLEECILQCSRLLRDAELRQTICNNGVQHVQEIGVGNEDICRQILSSI